MGVFSRASVGFRPLLAPLLFCLVGWFGAVLIWAVLSLPSFVLGLVFRFLSCVALLSYTFAILGSKCGMLLFGGGDQPKGTWHRPQKKWFVALWYLPFLHAISPALT